MRTSEVKSHPHGALPHETFTFQPYSFDAIPGWTKISFTEDFFRALFYSASFFFRGAVSKRRGQWHADTLVKAYQKAFTKLQPFCSAEHNDHDEFVFKDAFQEVFRAYKINCPKSFPSDQTFFTGYYHPVLKASKVREGSFQIPLYKRPENLVVIEDLGVFRSDLAGIRIAGTLKNQSLVPFFTRADVNKGALENQNLEIGWVQDPLDAFLMMVQGSGTLKYTDNDQKTFHYDGTNGHPYTSIGKELIARGILSASNCSLESIRSWCQRASEKEVKSLLEKNASYVFFQESKMKMSPEGALEEALVSNHSLAVDPRYLPMGAPLWINFSSSQGGFSYMGPGFAHDVGGAIKGPLRADFYCGTGIEGEKKAGSLAAKGNLYLFLPKELSPEDLIINQDFLKDKVPSGE